MNKKKLIENNFKDKFILKEKDLKIIEENYSKTPFYLYLEEEIIKRCQKLNQKFKDEEIIYKNYFAVKSNSNMNVFYNFK
jgi:diaminopimelate decarboxylase